MKDLNQYTAAILCGGLSRRMGVDKATALVNSRGEPLLAALAEELAARFGELLLITNDLQKLKNFTKLSPYKRLLDLHPGAGPAGAVHTALRGMGAVRKAVFIMACDMPVVDWGLIERLADTLEFKGADIAVPRHGGGLEPLYAFYGAGCEAAFARGLEEGRRKVWSFYEDVKTSYLDLEEEDTGAFSNLNTPEDVMLQGATLLT